MCHEEVRTHVLMVCQLPSIIMEHSLEDEEPMPDMPDIPDIPDIPDMPEWSCEVMMQVCGSEQVASECDRCFVYMKRSESRGAAT